MLEAGIARSVDEHPARGQRSRSRSAPDVERSSAEPTSYGRPSRAYPAPPAPPTETASYDGLTTPGTCTTKMARISHGDRLVRRGRPRKSMVLELVSGDAACDLLYVGCGQNNGALLHGLSQDTANQSRGRDMFRVGTLA